MGSRTHKIFLGCEMGGEHKTVRKGGTCRGARTGLSMGGET